MNFDRDSRTGAALRRATAAARAALRSSAASGVTDRAHRTTRTAYANSRLDDAIDRIDGAVRSSWAFRWLTAEPEADVVVVDLRETTTVGPVLAVLDGTFRAVVPAWRSAATGRLTRDTRDAFERRPVRAASQVALVAVATNLVLRLATGTLDHLVLGGSLLLAALALAGTRSEASSDAIADSRSVRLLRSILRPPDPPDSDDGN